MPKITLNSEIEIKSEPGSTILSSAQASGISLPYSCNTGRCATCRCKVISGSTEAVLPETGLNDAERAKGWVLSCVRSAVSDVVLEVDDLGGVQLPSIKTLPARISAIERMTADVMKVTLRLPPTVQLEYIPGQYIEVISPRGDRRSYSLANAPRANKTIELHIRAVEHGKMSAYWFAEAKLNDLVRINGPLGTFFMRGFAGKHLIFLATGTGIAPVKAMLEQLAHAEGGSPARVTVLWGGRTRSDLYFDLACVSGEICYVPVLSRPDDGWMGAKGYVQDVLLAMTELGNDSMVYACGSDVMIRSAKSVLINAGLAEKSFYSDAFVCSSTG